MAYVVAVGGFALFIKFRHAADFADLGLGATAASAAVIGKTEGISPRLQLVKFKHPVFVGRGVSNNTTTGVCASFHDNTLNGNNCHRLPSAEQRQSRGQDGDLHLGRGKHHGNRQTSRA